MNKLLRTNKEVILWWDAFEIVREEAKIEYVILSTPDTIIRASSLVCKTHSLWWIEWECVGTKREGDWEGSFFLVVFKSKYLNNRLIEFSGLPKYSLRMILNSYNPLCLSVREKYFVHSDQYYHHQQHHYHHCQHHHNFHSLRSGANTQTSNGLLMKQTWAVLWEIASSTATNIANTDVVHISPLSSSLLNKIFYIYLLLTSTPPHRPIKVNWTNLEVRIPMWLVRRAILRKWKIFTSFGIFYLK